VPIGLLNQPKGPVVLALPEPQASEPGLNAGQAVRVERLRLLRQLLQPLVLRRLRLRFRLGRLAEKPAEEGPSSEGERERVGRGKRKGFGKERELLGR